MKREKFLTVRENKLKKYGKFVGKPVNECMNK